jgi:hypothetical protein
LFSGSTNRYSPSGKQKRNKTLLIIACDKEKDEGRRKHTQTQMVFDPGLFSSFLGDLLLPGMCVCVEERRRKRKMEG